MGGLGLVLGIWCIIMLPSTYRFQAKFNNRKEQMHRQKIERKERKANERSGVDVGNTLCLFMLRYCPGATQRER